MNSTKRLAVVVALLLTGLMISPAAAAGGGIEVTLTAPDASVPARSGVWVEATYTNTSASTASIVKWQTPVNGLEAPLFDVTIAGQPVPYIGRLVKRGPPTPADFLTIPAGGSLTFDVNLADSYSFRGTGQYTVGFSTGDPRARALISNDLTLRVAGRPDPVPNLVTPIYSGCTAPQQTGLAAALTSANTYATGAQSHFSASRSGPRYLEWFGAMDPTRYATVKGHYDKITSALATATVTFDCGTCTDSAYAYVYPNQPYKIYLCGSFWGAPNTGTDSRAGTLIHELSHFTVLGGTDDHAYGQSRARNLAITDPSRAVMNADSHEYFAENTPVLNNGPLLSLSSTTHDFGRTAINTTSPAKTFTITNSGDTSLVTGTLSTSGPFAVSPACNATTILPAGSCVFSVTFTPTGGGAQSGTVRIPGNVLTAGSVTLSGSAAAPGVGLTPSSHDFGEQAVSTTSAASTLRITNTGDSPLTLGTITVTSPFMGSTACNSKVLAAGAYCDLTTTFSPTTVGPTSGTIRIPSDAAGSPHTMSLTGSGVQPAVTLSRTSHGFGEVEVGTTSAATTIAVISTGTAPVAISSITAPAGFLIDESTCRTATLAPQQSCSFSVAFQPVVQGGQAAQVEVKSTATGSPATVDVNGYARPADTGPVVTSVSAKAVSGKDKLRVRVQPDRGPTTQWAFHVQKRAAGRWATLPKTRRTKGAAHTVRVNLPRGKYRVTVDAVAGYLASVSNAVRLLR